MHYLFGVFRVRFQAIFGANKTRLQLLDRSADFRVDKQICGFSLRLEQKPTRTYRILYFASNEPDF